MKVLFCGGGGRPQQGAEPGGRWGGGGGSRPGVGGGEQRGTQGSFMSQLSAGAVQRCPWPGAWDMWVEECLRDAQVGCVVYLLRD